MLESFRALLPRGVPFSTKASETTERVRRRLQSEKWENQRTVRTVFGNDIPVLMDVVGEPGKIPKEDSSKTKIRQLLYGIPVAVAFALGWYFAGTTVQWQKTEAAEQKVQKLDAEVKKSSQEIATLKKSVQETTDQYLELSTKYIKVLSDYSETLERQVLTKDTQIEQAKRNLQTTWKQTLTQPKAKQESSAPRPIQNHEKAAMIVSKGLPSGVIVIYDPGSKEMVYTDSRGKGFIHSRTVKSTTTMEQLRRWSLWLVKESNQKLVNIPGVAEPVL